MHRINIHVLRLTLLAIEVKGKTLKLRGEVVFSASLILMMLYNLPKVTGEPGSTGTMVHYGLNSCILRRLLRLKLVLKLILLPKISSVCICSLHFINN